MSGAQQGEQIQGRGPVAVRRGGGNPIQGTQGGVLPAGHSKHKIVVNQHRDINVQLRGVDQVQQPDHRPSIADHDDGFQPLGLQDGVRQSHAGGESRRAPMRGVNRVQVRETVSPPDPRSRCPWSAQPIAAATPSAPARGSVGALPASARNPGNTGSLAVGER